MLSFRFFWRFILLTGVAGSFLLPVVNAAEAGYAPGVVALFSTPDVWPWGYSGQGGKPAGMLPDLIGRLSVVAGIPVNNRLRPHRRAIRELETGEADFVPLFQSPVNDQAGIRVGLITRVRILLTSLAGDHPPASMDDLAGQAVGFIRGTYYGPAFEQADRVDKIPVDGLTQAVEMLRLGRIDALVSSDQALYHTLAAMDLPVAAFHTRTVIASQAAWLYMSRRAKHPQLLEPVRAAMQQLRESGELDEIFRLPR